MQYCYTILHERLICEYIRAFYYHITLILFVRYWACRFYNSSFTILVSYQTIHLILLYNIAWNTEVRCKYDPSYRSLHCTLHNFCWSIILHCYFTALHISCDTFYLIAGGQAWCTLLLTTLHISYNIPASWWTTSYHHALLQTTMCIILLNELDLHLHLNNRTANVTSTPPSSPNLVR